MNSFRNAWLLTLFLLWFGPGGEASSPGAQPARPAPPGAIPLPLVSNKPIQADKGDDELHSLLKERYNAALRELQDRYRLFQTGGGGSSNLLFEAAQRVRDSGLALTDKPADQIHLRQQYLDLAKGIERVQEAALTVGTIQPPEVSFARYMRLEAQIQLLQAQHPSRP
ncbi:MAG: hypothetical protein JO112_03370 [Planctomycetes bacterium]|nr:hypothetical protein [Planctomycetota bacterium]